MLLIHTASTLLMTGVILIIQWVHYPSFIFIHAAKQSAAMGHHQKRISFIVIPLMLTEAITAIILIRDWAQFPMVYSLNGALLLLIWIHTFFIMVPIHQQLCSSYSATDVHRLVKQNMVRTLAWGSRSLILLGIWLF